jgi:hypothetical protein
MVDVKVTVVVGRKTLSATEVTDARIAGPLKAAGKDIGTKLAKVKCPEHKQGPTNVRLHFDASGNGDLKYDGCCGKLAEVIEKKLA